MAGEEQTEGENNVVGYSVEMDGTASLVLYHDMRYMHVMKHMYYRQYISRGVGVQICVATSTNILETSCADGQIYAVQALKLYAS